MPQSKRPSSHRAYCVNDFCLFGQSLAAHPYWGHQKKRLEIQALLTCCILMGSRCKWPGTHSGRMRMADRPALLAGALSMRRKVLRRAIAKPSASTCIAQALRRITPESCVPGATVLNTLLNLADFHRASPIRNKNPARGRVGMGAQAGSVSA